jgi:hypothetical protein
MGRSARQLDTTEKGDPGEFFHFDKRVALKQLAFGAADHAKIIAKVETLA